MQIQDLQPKTTRQRAKQIGRGGKRGKTAGRGTKGQRTRAGHKIRPELRDLIKKLPKKRGYRFQSHVAESRPVNLSLLEKNFAVGTVITPTLLVEKGLVKRDSGKVPTVKILGTGEVTKSFVISDCLISGTARTKIEAAGGSTK